MQTWNERAKDRLKELRLTQEWLAEQFDMTPGGMQKWLAGTREPSLADINRIAELLRCSPVWLTHGVGHPTELAWYTPPAALPAPDAKATADPTPAQAAPAVVMALPAKPAPDCYWPFEVDVNRARAALQPEQIAILNATMLQFVENAERASEQQSGKNRRALSNGQA